MTEVAIEQDSYLQAFQESEARKGNRLYNFRRTRKDAMDRFQALGFPTTRDEDWKYTNTAPIARTPFRLAPEEKLTGAGIQELEKAKNTLFGKVVRSVIVFVNGRYDPWLSSTGMLPEGVRVCSLARILENESRLVDCFMNQVIPSDNLAFTELNTAFLDDGAVVLLEPGAVLEEPVGVLFFSTANGAATMTHPRTLIIAADHSQATVIEGYAGMGESGYFTNAMTEVALGPNAVLDHYKLQTENSGAFHVGSLDVAQLWDSNFSSFSLSLGGALVRNDIRIRLDGRGCESTMNGLYLASGEQHVDNHTAIDHASPHCNSREVYHGVLDGSSTAVFNGKIFVRQDAQKTDARQTNRNLLLSRNAVIDTKPQLEIFADDVKCTHGATVGQLDEEAIFYLRARGIPHEEARTLLTYAFASEIAEKIQLKPLQPLMEQLIFGWLSAAPGVKERV